MKRTFIPLVLLLAGVGAYANGLKGAFLFDDRSSVLENLHIQSLWPLSQAMTAERQSVVAGRPLVALSFALNYAMGGLQVWGYHAVNLALHLLNVLLLFGIVRRTLRQGRWAAGSEAQAAGLAFVTALLWELHPLLTESIMYVTQRTELLMGTCYLLTLYSAIRALAVRRSAWWTAAAITACAAGMASKEVMVTAPLMVVLYDGVVAFPSWRQAIRRRWKLYAGLAATWVILAALVIPGPRSESAGFHFARVTPWRYVLTQPGVILQYVRLAVWPHPLVLDYHDWPLAQSVRDVWPSLVAVLALLGLTTWAIVRRWWAGFLGAWFFLILAPTSSFLPIMTEVAAERRMYLPLIALVMLGVIGGWWLLRRLPLTLPVARGVAVAVVAALAAAAAARTVARNADYRSEERMWRRTVATRPHNARAQNNLGNALWREGAIEEAASHYERALQLEPIYADAYANLGNVRLRAGQTAEAINLYRKALQLKPTLASAHNNLGNALYRLKRYDDALRHYQQALQLKPSLIESYNNIGSALFMLGRVEEARRSFEEALRYHPSYAEAHNGLGVVLRRQGHVEEALRHFQAALQIAPNHLLARKNLEATRAGQRTDRRTLTVGE